MDKDANVEAKSNNGWTALHHACHYQRNPDIIQLLFELKADADAETNDGSTPLHLASRNENTTREIIDLLIEKQANVYAENNDGWSPLQHAHPDVVDLLLHHHTKNANSNDKPGHVCISGGGPVGLITAAMLLDNSRISDQHLRRSISLIAVGQKTKKVEMFCGEARIVATTVVNKL